MELKEGFKRTDVGLIPVDWEVKKLHEVAKFQNGKAHENAISESGKYIVVNSKFISTQGEVCKYSNENLSPLKIGDIAMVMSDIPNGKALARCFFVRQKERFTLNQRICSIEAIKAYNKFLFYLLNRNKYFLEFDSGVGQTNLRKDEVLECPLPLPPLSEQKKIAKILSTWDKAIEMTEKLLTAKQTRKRALMQRLLTGKQRFPQFAGQSWREVKLSDVFERVTRKNDEVNTNVVTISAQRGFVRQTDFFNKSIASEILDNYFLVEKGEFCYNKSYSNGYPWGATKRLKDFDKAVVTTLYICFKFKDKTKHSGDFFEHFFEAGLLDRGLTKIAHEGGRAHGLLNVTPSDFFTLKITIPTLTEQIAIAQILQTVDKEIDLLKKQRDALKQQKRGLMQKLLTGKIRVKIDEN